MIWRALLAVALTKISPSFPIPSTRYDKLNDTLDFIKFMQEYGVKLNYGGLYRLLIRDLNVSFDIRDKNFEAYRTYFEVRDRMNIYRIGKRIFSEVEGCRFMIPFPFGLLELKETFMEDFYESDCIRGKTVLDAGAFIGDTAVYFAKHKASHVFAYEPSPFLFKIAAENVQLNGLSDTITLRNEAVTAAQGLVSFQYDEKWPGGSTISPEWPGGSTISTDNSKKNLKTFQVQGTALEGILREVGDVGLLKLDIEGAEHQIISDAGARNLRKHVENIIMEVHGSNINILKILQANGYDVKVVKAFSTPASMVSAKRKTS